MSQRAVIRGSLGLAATGSLARPHIANAQAKTAVCWLNQGFIPQENAAMKEVAEACMKASGAVGTYALLLAWNEYLYSFLLLSTPDSMTVAVALAQFLNSDESPWNYMMATAISYALPPMILYYGSRRYVAAGLTMGGVKG
jgi:hypothetical protein